jgi:hypothetical protein
MTSCDKRDLNRSLRSAIWVLFSSALRMTSCDSRDLKRSRRSASPSFVQNASSISIVI